MPVGISQETIPLNEADQGVGGRGWEILNSTSNEIRCADGGKMGMWSGKALVEEFRDRLVRGVIYNMSGIEVGESIERTHEQVGPLDLGSRLSPVHSK